MDFGARKNEKLVVKIIGFDFDEKLDEDHNKVYTLQIVQTTPWCASLGLAKDLIIKTLRRTYTNPVCEFWIPEDAKLPWMTLGFKKDGSGYFEHYR